MASIGAPAGTAGSGRGFDCGATADGRCVSAVCECLARKRSYDTALGALAVGERRAAKAVMCVAVGREEFAGHELGDLLAGLDVLVAHFGLMARSRRRQ